MAPLTKPHIILQRPPEPKDPREDEEDEAWEELQEDFMWEEDVEEGSRCP